MDDLTAITVDRLRSIRGDLAATVALLASAALRAELALDDEHADRQLVAEDLIAAVRRAIGPAPAAPV